MKNKIFIIIAVFLVITLSINAQVPPIIEDLTDKGCKDCSLVIDDQESITFDDKNNLLIHEKSKDQVSYQEYPAGTKFLVTANGIEVFLPPGTKPIQVTEKDTLTLNTQGNQLNINGFDIKGDVEIKEGKITVLKAGSEIIQDDKAYVVGYDKKVIDRKDEAIDNNKLKNLDKYNSYLEKDSINIFDDGIVVRSFGMTIKEPGKEPVKLKNDAVLKVNLQSTISKPIEIQLYNPDGSPYVKIGDVEISKSTSKVAIDKDNIQVQDIINFVLLEKTDVDQKKLIQDLNTLLGTNYKDIWDLAKLDRTTLLTNLVETTPEYEYFRGTIEQKGKIIYSDDKTYANPHQSSTSQSTIAAQTKPLTHKVKSGENPWAIAKKYNVDLNELMRLNGIKDTTKLQIGKELKIPGKTVELTTKKEGTTYSNKGSSKHPVTKTSQYLPKEKPLALTLLSQVNNPEFLSGLVPKYSRISSRLGWRQDPINPLSGKKQLHNGFDVAAPHGSPVLFPNFGDNQYGVVEKKSKSISGGNTLYMKMFNENGAQVVDSSGRQLVLIMHHFASGSIKVKSGQKLLPGTYLGGIGSTGRSTGPHLDIRFGYVDSRTGKIKTVPLGRYV